MVYVFVARNPFGGKDAEVDVYRVSVSDYRVHLLLDYKQFVSPSTGKPHVCVMQGKPNPYQKGSLLLYDVGVLSPGRFDGYLVLRRPVTEAPYLVFVYSETGGCLGGVIGKIDLRRFLVSQPSKLMPKPVPEPKPSKPSVKPSLAEILVPLAVIGGVVYLLGRKKR